MSPDIHHPQQERSRASMTRILDAAERLLEDKTFEELTVAEVVQQAGISVGAFYGRFKDKDALLLALDERFSTQFEAEFNALVGRPGLAQQPIPDIIREVVDFMAAAYSRHSGLLRSLDLKARLQGGGPFKPHQQRLWLALYPFIQEVLLAHPDQIAHPNPLLAARLGFQQLVFTIHELYLWVPLRGGRAYDRDELCAELTRAFLAYLAVTQD